MMTAALLALLFILLGLYVIHQQLDEINSQVRAANEKTIKKLQSVCEAISSVENTILQLWGCPACGGTGRSSSAAHILVTTTNCRAYQTPQDFS